MLNIGWSIPRVMNRSGVVSEPILGATAGESPMGLKGDFQFVEARMGQIVNFLLIELENAIQIVNQFFKEVEPLIENSKESPTEGKWVRI